jgi:glutathione S-transferase
MASLKDSADVFGSTLASSLRLWYGTGAREAKLRPEKLLELYEFEACPYCRRVREALTALNLEAMVYPCPKGGKRYRPRVKAMGGKTQFPYLVDPNTGTAMYESADIIQYLYKTYGGRRAPLRLPEPLDVLDASLVTLVRGGAGRKARPSKAPAQPLELYSFESSPFSRRVRELLCELEIPYHLHNTGKVLVKDLGPPGLRKALFPDAPVKGRKRRELLERGGKVQLPFLVDPNTGTQMYESADIRWYLMQTYAA